jgi:hypothetical protein
VIWIAFAFPKEADMYRWIIEADIYRLKKALRDDPQDLERRTLERRLAVAEARLTNART